MEDRFKPLYKKHRKASIYSLDDVFDPRSDLSYAEVVGYSLTREQSSLSVQNEDLKTETCWRTPQLPGLNILVNKLSPHEEKQLVKEALIDYLQSDEHLTNLDAHYDLKRPIQLFQAPMKGGAAEVEQRPGKKALVREKLRWVTIGGQYNWTTKEYPSLEPGTPEFPEYPKSLSAKLCSALNMRPEAAIVNYYSDGDILSPHQDVAEVTDRNLVSISLGCACIFYIAKDRYGMEPLPILLRSGDIIIMSGESRFAFHGVGRVFNGTSPEYLLNNLDDHYGYSEWMMSHRININARQVLE